LAAASLLAVLASQIVIVRSRTPRLPEAIGPREGQSGKDPALKVLITGESPAAGVGVNKQEDGLAGQLAEALLNHHGLPCHWHVAARTGLMAAEAGHMIVQSPIYFDVVIIVLGVNDSKNLRSRTAFRSDLLGLLKTLRTHHPRASLLWCGIPDLSLFPALPIPLSWLLGWRSRMMDRELAWIADYDQDSQHLPIKIEDDRSFASDGFHPGVAGYKEWANHLAQVIRDRMNH
jgi:lysophospholipase L1-like esterase